MRCARRARSMCFASTSDNQTIDEISVYREMRVLFEHIRRLVEKRYGLQDDQNRELPLQSVSAFCFLRFIVPAILHPHLFGILPGIPHGQSLLARVD